MKVNQYHGKFWLSSSASQMCSSYVLGFVLLCVNGEEGGFYHPTYLNFLYWQLVQKVIEELSGLLKFNTIVELQFLYLIYYLFISQCRSYVPFLPVRSKLWQNMKNNHNCVEIATNNFFTPGIIIKRNLDEKLPMSCFPQA